MPHSREDRLHALAAREDHPGASVYRTGIRGARRRRYGGEEFVIAFAETPLTDAAATCERIRRAIEEHPWQEVHPDLHVTMTIGVDGETARG